MKALQVYKVQNLLNNKVYIGITVKNYKRRWKDHQKEVKYGSTFIFHNAIRKHGPENFEITLLETVATPEELKEREKFWIAAFDSTNRDKGYNMTLGGDGTFGRLHSEETKRKIGEKALGRKHRNGVTYQTTIENLTTKEISVYRGITEACAAMGWSQGYLSSKKTQFGNSFIVKGNYQITLEKETFIPTQKLAKELTPEQKQIKVDKFQAGVRAWREANPGLESQIRREQPHAIAARKPVEQWTKDGQTLLATYPSTRDAAEATGAKKCNIATCARGKEKCYPKGFLWKYSQSVES